MIYGTIGIHPHESSKDIIKSDEIIKNLKENEKIIGIGDADEAALYFLIISGE